MKNINLNGYEWEWEILDSTHLRMRISGSWSWCIPKHIAQLSDEILEQLCNMGKVTSDNYFQILGGK